MTSTVELRLLCHQLTSLPHEDLPRNLRRLTGYIAKSRAILQCPSDQLSKREWEGASVLLHRLKTQITSLLHGKHAQQRYAAAVLIKAVTEVGGWEMVKASEPWVRGLIAILQRPESVVIKRACIIALTKIYCLTHAHPSLLREVTTPTLPSFIMACLSLLSPRPTLQVSASLEDAVLCCLALLLPQHTTVFRPFASQMRGLLKSYLAPTGTEKKQVSPSVSRQGRCLSVLLHQCVARDTGAESWAQALKQTIRWAHETSDRVFRAVVEEWEPRAEHTPTHVATTEPLQHGGLHADDLSTWKGIASGIDRLVGLLNFVRAYFEPGTPHVVTIPLGSILDLIIRLLSIRISTNAASHRKDGSYNQIRSGIDRDERDELATRLPEVQKAAMDLIISISDMLGMSSPLFHQRCLELILWAFPTMQHDDDLREASYRMLNILLPMVGPGLTKDLSKSTILITKTCCQDANDAKHDDANDTDNSSEMLEAGLVKAKASKGKYLPISRLTGSLSRLARSAQECLSLLLSHVPQQYLDITTRATLERTAILTENKDAMLASILHPYTGANARGMPSILPHFARAYPKDPVLDIFLRPRLPQIPLAYREHSTAGVCTCAETNGHSHGAETMLPNEMDDGNHPDPPHKDYIVSGHRTAHSAPGLVLPPDDIVTETSPPFHRPPTIGTSQSAVVVGQVLDEGHHSSTLAVSMPSTTAGSEAVAVLADTVMSEDSDSDESVHLVMDLDSEPDDGMGIGS